MATNEISILFKLFCDSLGSRFRLLLGLVKVLQRMAFRDLLPFRDETVGLAGFGMEIMESDGSDDAFLLLRLHLRVAYVEMA